jgi:hypothetical protein
VTPSAVPTAACLSVQSSVNAVGEWQHPYFRHTSRVALSNHGFNRLAPPSSVGHVNCSLPSSVPDVRAGTLWTGAPAKGKGGTQLCSVGCAARNV